MACVAMAVIFFCSSTFDSEIQYVEYHYVTSFTKLPDSNLQRLQYPKQMNIVGEVILRIPGGKFALLKHLEQSSFIIIIEQFTF